MPKGKLRSKKNINFVIDLLRKVSHPSLPSQQAMKSNRTHHNQLEALFARQGMIPCTGARGRQASVYLAKDWSLPIMSDSEQDESASP